MAESNWQAAEEDALFDESEAFNLDKFDSNKDSILFVIDCAPEMFLINPQLTSLASEDNESDESTVSMSAFSAALKCASATMQNKIISSENDRVGVLFYNTGESKNPAGFPGIFLMLPLDIPDAPGIRELERFAKKPELFRERYCNSSSVPANRDLPFGNVFWTTATLFSEQKEGTKRVFLFTCEDNPNASSPALQRAARTRGRDLSDIGIALELFALPKPSSPSAPFNPALFYSSIIPPTDAQDAGNIAKFEELLARVRRREQRKRALARTELALGPDFALSVRLYSLFMEAKRGQYVWMDERSGEVMMPKTEWICKETGAIIDPKTFQFSYDYGQEKAIFTKEECMQFHSLGEEPGLKVIGFKPRSALKVTHNLTHSTFIYPDEMEIRGSVPLFAALLKGCAEANQFVLCRYIARKGAAIRLVALLPQVEELDELGSQVKAPGFHMIILPFADDLRHLRFDEKEQRACATHEQIDKAKAVIGKLTLKGRFDPDSYDNPMLQHHYTTLQALALDEESPETTVDASMPNFGRMQQRAASQLEEFKAVLDWDSCAPPQEPETARTKAKQRQISHEAETGESLLAAVKEAAKKGQVDDLNGFMVVDLKAYLESVGIKPKRIKADLINQIIEHNC